MAQMVPPPRQRRYDHVGSRVKEDLDREAKLQAVARQYQRDAAMDVISAQGSKVEQVDDEAKEDCRGDGIRIAEAFLAGSIASAFM